MTTASDPPDAATHSSSGRRMPRVVWLAVIAVVSLALVAGAVMVVRGTASGGALGPPTFVDEATAAGIDHAYSGGYPYIVGGGVAAFDCDDDGKPDLYLAGGAGSAALYRNDSPVGGALRFERRPATTTDLTAVTGAYPLDIDGDGHQDLVVLRFGENVVLRGLGECRFERANEAFAIDGGDSWTTAFSATWETPTSPLPTLAFGEYADLDANLQAIGTCGDGSLVRPDASGSRYASAVALHPGWCALSMLFSDWDRSGRPDLRISNDRHYYRDGEEQLWRIAPGQEPHLYTREEGWARLRLWGMGIASQDLTGDGLPEVYLTSQGDNKLQTLADGPSQPTYRDIALARGVIAFRPYAGGDTLPSTAWHPEFADVNDDGFPDLFVTKGNVDGETDHAMLDPSNLLLGQVDGTFVDVAEAAGLMAYGQARGAALVDLNLDGLVDLVEVVRNEPVRAYRNVGSGTAAQPAPMGHWLALDLDQGGPNRDSIGAWISVRHAGRIEQHEVTVGGGHVSGHSGWIHLGLGDATQAEVQVQWPDGTVGPWLPVTADQFVHVVQGADAVQPWQPSRG